MNGGYFINEQKKLVSSNPEAGKIYCLVNSNQAKACRDRHDLSMSLSRTGETEGEVICLKLNKNGKR